MRTTDVLNLLADQLADAETAWSLGTFGAIAEFTRDADEGVTLDRDDRSVSAVTARGGVRIEAGPDLRPIASESLTSESWNHRVALCLPLEACAMSGRMAVAEIGPDRDALRAEDRASVLFDLGLGALQVDCCVRSSSAALTAELRNWVGRSVFLSDNGAMSAILGSNPHRVFISRIGRIEVFQPIPPPEGKSPAGPHTHVLPKLLRSGRTHAATEPLPAGWVPCAHFYPPNPARDHLGHRQPFQESRHAAFQVLLARYGNPQLINIKRRVVESVTAGRRPSAVSVAGDRFCRTIVRVALRQLKASDLTSPVLAEWLAAHDASIRTDPNRRTGISESS